MHFKKGIGYLSLTTPTQYTIHTHIHTASLFSYNAQQKTRFLLYNGCGWIIDLPLNECSLDT